MCFSFVMLKTWKPIKIFLSRFYLAPCIFFSISSPSMSMHGNKYICSFTLHTIHSFSCLFYVPCASFYCSIFQYKVKTWKNVKLIYVTHVLSCMLADFYHTNIIRTLYERHIFLLLKIICRWCSCYIIWCYWEILLWFTLSDEIQFVIPLTIIIIFRKHIDKFLFITQCKF